MFVYVFNAQRLYNVTARISYESCYRFNISFNAYLHAFKRVMASFQYTQGDDICYISESRVPNPAAISILSCTSDMIWMTKFSLYFSINYHYNILHTPRISLNQFKGQCECIAVRWAQIKKIYQQNIIELCLSLLHPVTDEMKMPNCKLKVHATAHFYVPT